MWRERESEREYYKRRNCRSSVDTRGQRGMYTYIEKYTPGQCKARLRNIIIESYEGRDSLK